MRRTLRLGLATLAVVGLVPMSSGPDRYVAADAAAIRGPLLTTSPVTGAVITGTTSVTLFVSNQATNGYAIGSDTNAGTSPGAPLLTINEAARRANRNQAGVGTPDGPVGTLIKINDGTYHEFIDWRGYKRVFETNSYTMVSHPTVGAQVPVVFEAENAGAVRIDGADTTRTTGTTTVSYATDAAGADAWQATTLGAYTGYSHRWVDELAQPIDLGFFPNPFGPGVEYGTEARRREMAFIDARLGGENQRVRLLFTRFEILDPDNRIHGDDIPGNVLRIDHVRALQLLLQLFEIGLFLGYRCFRRPDEAGQSIHIVSRYPDFSFTHGHPLAGQYC